MIETQSLTRRFGPLLAVDELTLSIPDGEIFGLLGPNGAGKTTTLRMLAGLIGITSGMAIVNGRDVADPAQAPAVRASLGLLPEENGLYSDLTVWQTLDFFARLHHVPDRRQRVRDLLQQMSMLERSDARVSTLSKGMKQRLAIARALINEPRLVLLDEPTANLDPEASRQVREVIVALRNGGATVIINTHRLEEAERLCDRIGILRTRLLRVLDPQASRRDTLLLEFEAHSAEALAVSRAFVSEEPELLPRGLRLRLRPDVAPADLVAALVSASVRIVSVIPERPSLEDIYLEAIADAH